VPTGANEVFQTIAFYQNMQMTLEIMQAASFQRPESASDSSYTGGSYGGDAGGGGSTGGGFGGGGGGTW
jgi:uncharacterized membrane protein